MASPGPEGVNLEKVMKRRQPVNKYSSAAKFRNGVKRTKLMNVLAVQRGGIRL